MRHNAYQMKSSDRLFSVVALCIAVGGAVQGALLLPYRMDQNERATRESDLKFQAEIKEVKKQADDDRARSNEVKEIVARVEERLKGVQATVEAMDRRQRTFTGSPGFGN